MLNFASMVAEFFTAAWDFLSTLFESLVTLFSMIGLAVALPAVLPGIVPAVIGSTILAVVSLAVVKLIVGRQ